jgi:type III pantothenate kinase
MILECDIGNSFCKWRIVGASGQIEGAGRFTYKQGFDAILLQSDIERARTACVAGGEIEGQFRQWLDSSLGLEAEFARTASQCEGVSCAYSQPSKLGVDRWLALIAGYQQVKGAVLVIDVGSALTIDAVDAAGVHLGGYIIPGQQLMANSLLHDTEQVRFESVLEAASPRFGASTGGSVYGGIAAALLGTVNVAVTEANEQIPEGFAILFTGGGGHVLQEQMPEGTRLVPDLVLDGLRWVLP